MFGLKRWHWAVILGFSVMSMATAGTATLAGALGAFVGTLLVTLLIVKTLVAFRQGLSEGTAADAEA